MRAVNLQGNSDLWHDGWAPPNDGDLETHPEFGTGGFNALPGGIRYAHNGNYTGMGVGADFWSSSEIDSVYAWYRMLNYLVSSVWRGQAPKKTGLSIRCLQD